jgi:hypothetical protein
MSEFFSFDPVTGITDTWDYNEQTGDAVVHRSADVEGLLKATADARLSGAADKHWKNDMPSLYAEIDPITQVELLKKGIDIFKLNDPTMRKRFFYEIEINYPLLKTTNKKAIRA